LTTNKSSEERQQSKKDAGTKKMHSQAGWPLAGELKWTTGSHVISNGNRFLTRQVS